MLKSILVKIYKLLGNKNVSLISLFVTVVTTIILMRIDADLAGFGGSGIFYLQVAFTRSNFSLVLSSWKSGGVDMLVGLLWLYYINAASYAVLFSSTAAYFLAKGKNGVMDSPGKLEYASIVLPFFAALLDWISNALLYLVFTSRFLMGGLIMAYSTFALMKWLLIAASLILILRAYFSSRKVMKRSVP